MSQVCPKCNNSILEEHTVEISVIGGHKVLIHSECPQKQTPYMSGGGINIQNNDVKYRDINFEIKIDQNGNYVICDEGESDCMEEKWDNEDYGVTESCQTYSFIISLPIPSILNIETKVITQESPKGITMAIKS